MNPIEINKIKDINVLKIKQKYWDLKHKAFLDEYNIPDKELSCEYDKLTKLERNELEEYYKTLDK